MDEALNMTKSQKLMKIKELKHNLISYFNSNNYDYGKAHSLAWELMDYVQDLGSLSKDAVNLEILTDNLNSIPNKTLSAKDKAVAMNDLRHI